MYANKHGNANQMGEYNALDAACTLECKDKFWADLVNGGFLPSYDMTVDLYPVLTFLQTRGIKVDHEALVKTRDSIITKAAQLQEELNELCGRPLNVNSPKDCQQYFYVELGIPPYYNAGRVTVDDLALQRLSRGTAKRPGLRQAKLAQDIRGLQKLNGTYLSLEFDNDGRMRCSYNPRGTRFGRLSSSKTIFGTGTNNQNLPQEFKQFLTPDPGYVFWEVDKRQAEWVVVAYLTGDGNMLAAVQQGLDIHIHTAHLSYGVPKDILVQESKLIGMNSDTDTILELRSADPEIAQYNMALPRSMSGRQGGKKSNHAFNYDESGHAWALRNSVPEAEGKRNYNLYHQSYPGIKIWYQSIQRQLQADRTLVNCFGRRYRFMGSMDIDMYKAAYSFLPQSTVVDSLNQGMVKIYNDPELCSTKGANIDILAQVHDSILMQVPIEVVRDEQRFVALRDRIYDYISPELTYGGRTFKIATDSKMGLNWGGAGKNNPNGMKDINSHPEIITLLDSYNEQQRT